jgi:hypothetical protein
MGDTGTPHVSHISHSCAGPAHQPDRVAANRTSLVRALLFAPPLRALPSPLACLSSPDLPLICLLRRDEEEEIRVGAGGWKERRWQTVESEWKGGVGTSRDAQRQGANPCLIKKKVSSQSEIFQDGFVM